MEIKEKFLLKALKLSKTLIPNNRRCRKKVLTLDCRNANITPNLEILLSFKG